MDNHELRELLEHALNKLRNTMLSDEEKVRLENEMKEQTATFVNAYREIKENEAGVQVRSHEEISDIFQELILLLQEEVSEIRWPSLITREDSSPSTQIKPSTANR